MRQSPVDMATMTILENTRASAKQRATCPSKSPVVIELPEVKYMPMGVKIRLEWLSRRRAQMNLESNQAFSDRLGQGTADHDIEDTKIPVIPKRQLCHEKRGRFGVTEMKRDDTDKAVKGFSDIRDSNTLATSKPLMRTAPGKTNKIRPPGKVKTSSEGKSLPTMKRLHLENDRVVKVKPSSKVESSSVSSKSQLRKRSRSVKGTPTSKGKSRSASLAQQKRPTSAVSKEKRKYRVPICNYTINRGGVFRTKGRSHTQALEGPLSCPNLRNNPTSQADSMVFHQEGMNSSYTTESSQINIKPNATVNPCCNSYESSPSLNTDTIQGNDNIHHKIKRSTKQLKSASARQRVGPSHRKRMDKKVTFTERPDIQYTPNDLKSSVEVSRIRVALLPNLKSPRIKSRSSPATSTLQRSNSSFGVPISCSMQASSESIYPINPVQETPTGRPNDADVGTEGDTDPFGKLRAAELLHQVRKKLSQAKCKGRMSSRGVGFKSHLSRQVDIVMSQNQLPKTCPQLDVPVMAQNQQLKQVMLKSMSTSDLEKVETKVGHSQESNKQENEERKDNKIQTKAKVRKGRSLSCKSRVKRSSRRGSSTRRKDITMPVDIHHRNATVPQVNGDVVGSVSGGEAGVGSLDLTPFDLQVTESAECPIPKNNRRVDERKRGRKKRKDSRKRGAQANRNQ